MPWRESKLFMFSFLASIFARLEWKKLFVWERLLPRLTNLLRALLLSRTRSNSLAVPESIWKVCIGELKSRQLAVKSGDFLYETAKWKLGLSRDCKETIVKYLRHFHFRRVPKGDLQLLFVVSSFVPEGILGNENECDDVPKNITITYN